MINTQDILKIVKLVLLSGYLKKNKPISLLIVGKSGNGKTENIKYHKAKRAVFVTDLSYRGVTDLLKNDAQIKHLIVPDFLKITMKRRSTSDNLISLFNAMTEEGIGLIKVYNFEHDFKDRVCGLIVATTKSSFEQNRSVWTSIGFLSRMLVCSYDYSDETIEKILEYINSEQFLEEPVFEMIKGFKDVEVTSDKTLNSQLNRVANKKFRTVKQLQTLAKCNALLNKRKEVNQEDIDEIKRLAKYLNLNYTKI